MIYLWTDGPCYFGIVCKKYYSSVKPDACVKVIAEVIFLFSEIFEISVYIETVTYNELCCYDKKYTKIS